MTTDLYPSSPVRRYRWIPWLFVAAMSVVICVNGALVYFATRDPAGTMGKATYEAGLRFNTVLAERQRQLALGWQVAAGYVPHGEGSGEVVVELRDASGAALLGLQPHVTLTRPVGVVPPIAVDLADKGAGRYAAIVNLPRHGQWDLTIDIAQPQIFSVTHRVIVP